MENCNHHVVFICVLVLVPTIDTNNILLRQPFNVLNIIFNIYEMQAD